MTAEGAGVGERERMAGIALDQPRVQADDNRYDSPYVNDESLDSVFIDGRVNLHLLADALLAAGFGDVAQAKAEALEESATAIGFRLDTLWEEYADTEAPEYATISEIRDAILAHAAEYRKP